MGATKVTEQDPDSSVHVEGVNAPPVAPNETVPVGDAPVTVAVQLPDRPGAITVGEQIRDSDEGLGLKTATVTELEAADAPDPSVT